MKAVLLEEHTEKNKSAVVQKEGGQHMGTINIVTPISEAFHSREDNVVVASGLEKRQE